jgi:ligand-binding sensor domain-containing protein/signal transduction histidine kinase
MKGTALASRFRRLLLVSGLYCVAAHGTAPQAQPTRNFGQQSWSTENGLPQNSVHQILQTKDGYLWIATEGGVVRFNGTSFKVFNHETDPAFTSDDISCFAEDTDGHLWIGTSDGLLQETSRGFRRYTVADGLSSARIESIASSGGTLLVLTAGAIMRFDGKRFLPVSLSASSPPSALLQASHDMLWIVTANRVFQVQHGQSVSLPSPVPANRPIEGLGLLPDNGLWWRTRDNIILSKNGHVRTLSIGSALPGTRVETALADSNGTLWIGTDKGLVSLDRDAIHPQQQSLLGSSAILSLFQDREGNLWIGTEMDGLHVLRQQKFTIPSAFSGKTVTAIVQSADGAMWVGTDGDGLDRWLSGALRHFSSRNGLRSDIVLALAPAADGGVWVGTPDGLQHIGNGQFAAYTSADGLPDDFIRSLLLDDDGSLWIGTRRGLAHWKGGRFRQWTSADGLGSDLVGAMIRSHAPNAPHDLWVATFNGLSRLHEDTLSTYTTRDGLSGDVVTSLTEDSEGGLWIGTRDGGLSRWTTAGFTSLLRSDLPRTVDSILADALGSLWLSSSRGISRVDISRLKACGSSPQCDLQVGNYGQADGLHTGEDDSIGHPRAWRTRQGLLWFATRKGLAVADPAHLLRNSIPPPVQIEEFTVDDLALPVDGAEQTISPGHNRFAFEYAGLSYVSPVKVHYRYLLDGFDKKWIDAGSHRSAEYTNLPSRHYRFLVQAANDDGVWNETGEGLAFYVLPPLYRQPWFLLLSIALVTALAVLLYRLRVNRIQGQYNAVLAERGRIAREIHDTLAQGFVGVSIQLEIVARLLSQANVDQARHEINAMRTFVREGLADARRSIWDLRATSAGDALPVRLAHLVERYSTEQFSSTLDIGGAYRSLAPTLEDEVLRISQEALTNIARHAQASAVSVRLDYDEDWLYLAIEDDGRGFQSSDDSLSGNGHFGLRGMHERADRIQARLVVQSSPGAGTKIRLQVPSRAKKVKSHE